ncbi:MAG: adenylate/guanylate cyclase domain-containing protein [Acidobacteria bacterium]|nr:MAG: adenylate/guanylate cyclase domain-containing protein [Acidobacteriota bacterium]
MTASYDELCRSLSMTEIIQLQSALSVALRQRFERKAALAFSDIVGSTEYFARFGDEEGRRLQQRHLDLLARALRGTRGRIMNTAGDGALLLFDGGRPALACMEAFMKALAEDNAERAPHHRLAVRVGIHHGSLLTDDVQVTGDAVNLCARVAASAEPQEIRLTREAFNACEDARFRTRCRVLPPVTLKGVAGTVHLLALGWRDAAGVPERVRLDTGVEHVLPDQDVISFGRPTDATMGPSADIALRCRTEDLTRAISRWHFQLLRRAEGFSIRPISDAPTELNGRLLAKGEEVQVAPGDCVRVGSVLSLWLEAADIDQAQTVIQLAPEGRAPHHS